MVELIEFGVALRSQDDSELEQLYEELNGNGPVSSASTIRQALLLSYGDSAHYDLERAINLFNQVARTRRDEDPALRTFAELMAVMLIEHRSLAVDRNALARQRAENAERIESATTRIESLEGELEDMREALRSERQRSEELQSQLEALIELEEQLTLDDSQEDGAADD